MTEYLSAQVVIDINASFGGYPLDRNGIDGAINRPAAFNYGQEGFPGVWMKAGVYVHSFSSTQYFSDGNKRTAWTAAVTFLDLNGYQVRRDIADVEAEAFVLAVSRQLFNVPEDPDRTLRRAAEWFEVNTRAESAEAGGK